MDLSLVVVLDDFVGGNSGSVVVDLGYCGVETNACNTIWLPRNFKKVKKKIEKIKNEDLFGYQEIARK